MRPRDEEITFPSWLRAAYARSLGLNPDKALKDSYSVLARKHLAKTKLAAPAES
jgi:hypothetical protein